MARRLALAAGLCLAASMPAPAAAFDMPPFAAQNFRGNPLVGQIVAGDGTPSAIVDLLAAIKAADLVVVGETHDNGDHHRLQADILEMMTAGGAKPAVVFEMIPTDLKPALDAYLARGDRTAEGLGPALDWEKRGWPDWRIYQPIAEVALGAGLAILPGDLPRNTIRAVGRGGVAALSPEEVTRLGLDRPLAEPMRAELTQTLEQSHCGMLPADAVAPMLTVQRARDGALADALIAAAAGQGGGKALLITGAGHARRDWGVPALVLGRNSGAKIVSIALTEVSSETATLGDEGISAATPAPYDFLLFTPKADVSDPCEGMAAAMKKG